MFRVVLNHVSQFLKRVAGDIPAQPNALKSRRESSLHEEEASAPWNAASVLLVLALAVYVAGGLGFFVKVHVWDQMSAGEHQAILDAMVVDPVNFN